MYMIEGMIDMGLKEGQTWPTDAHRKVAQFMGLFNSRVTTRDALYEVVQAVIKVPADQIELVTAIDLATKYNVPYISLS